MNAQVRSALTTHLQPPPTLHGAQLYPYQPHPHYLHTLHNSSHLHTPPPLFLHHYHLHPQSSLPSEPNTLLQSPLSTTMKTLPILSARHSTQPHLSAPQAPPYILPNRQTIPLPPLTISPPNGPGRRLTLLLLSCQLPLQDPPPNPPYQNAKFLKMSGKLWIRM